MTNSNDAPKIHIDSDWKAEAQAEKQRLVEKDKQPKPASPGAATEPGQMPNASLEMLVSTMATQALFAMGAIDDPTTGQRIQNLDMARYHIDMLTVIEKKTKGNLTEEEVTLLNQSIYELRSRYIQMASAGRST